MSYSFLPHVPVLICFRIINTVAINSRSVFMRSRDVMDHRWMRLPLSWSASLSRREPAGDQVLIIVTVLLLAVGIMMMYSSSALLAQRRYEDTAFFLKRQSIWISVGLIMLYAVSHFQHRYWRKLIGPLLCIGLALLAVVLFSPLGEPINGARRWIRLGVMTIQPSEMIKVILIVYLACYLAGRGERIQSFVQGALPVVFVVGVFVSLIMCQPDLGTAVVILTVTGGMLFIGGVPVRHLAGLSTAALAMCAYLVTQTAYQRQRVLTFLNPWDDPMDSGFQTIQSMLAIGSGGIWGMGLGEGNQKRLFLPEPHTDFIFAVLAEELGLIGGMMVLGLYGVLIWRGFRIAWGSNDLLGYYLAYGITLLFSIQVLINVGVVSGMLPAKGLTIPFLSYGGSAIVMNLVAIGILISISRAREHT
ncbi:MAG TPA: putative lipid II flippase FtsW [Nitrospirales bacterium]|nr:putative lipid II flippase FtsW [Nitrospirales bacterium]